MANFALAIIIISALVNLVGALGPELSFDALWYHLTLPKLYLAWKKMPVIPGGLLYYSGMPQLVELFYLGALAVSSEILAKLIHWAFGVGCLILFYRLLRRYFDRNLSLIGAMVFYVTPVVGWLSTTAYVDLGRTFFELLALGFFFRWIEEGKTRWLDLAGLAMGLALSTKHLAWESVIIYCLTIFWLKRKDFWVAFSQATRFVFWALLVVWPWYFRAWKATKNPFYPLFTRYISSPIKLSTQSFLAPLLLFWRLTFKPKSIFTPIPLLLLPLAFLGLAQANRIIKIAGLMSFLIMMSSIIFPNHNIRYYLPYVPLLTMVCLTAFTFRWGYQYQVNKFLFLTIFLVSLVHLGIRAVANVKFLPVLLGRQTKDEFLSQHLNFEFGDFYDVDGFFAKNIKETDLVLIYNIHNLYYVNFPFVHESWATPKMKFTHVLVKDIDLPNKFGQLPLIYENKKTGVKLYLMEDR